MTTLEHIARAIYAAAEVRSFEDLPRHAHCWRMAQAALDAMPEPVARDWAVQWPDGRFSVHLERPAPAATFQRHEIDGAARVKAAGARAFRCLLVEDDGT